MIIEKTQEMVNDDNIVMVLYGKGGVGKTSFVATAPKPLLIDFENGSKYLGQRGFDIDVIRQSAWFSEADRKQLPSIIKNYDTIIIDPLGEAFDKIIESQELNNKKFKQYDGSLTMAGWGEAKKMMKSLIKFLRDSRKNVIIVSHVSEIQDENTLYHRIQVQTKLKDEIPTMVDIISYMAVVKDKEQDVRYIYTPAQGSNFDSKDRTGRMPEKIKISEKNGWNDMINAMKHVKQQSKTTPETYQEKPVKEIKDADGYSDSNPESTIKQGDIVEGVFAVANINETLVTWIESEICKAQGVIDYAEWLINNNMSDKSKNLVIDYFKNLEQGNEDVSYLVDSILCSGIIPNTKFGAYEEKLRVYKMPDSDKEKFYNALGGLVNAVKGEA